MTASRSRLVLPPCEPGEVSGQSLRQTRAGRTAGVVCGGAGVTVELLSSLDVSNILQLGTTVSALEAGDTGGSA